MMRFNLTGRTRDALALAASAVPLLVGNYAFGQTYSTTPTTVFTAASLGLAPNGTAYSIVALAKNSTSYPSGVVEEDSGVLAGSIKTTGSPGNQQLFYLSPQSPFPNTPNLVAFSDAGHTLSTFSAPSLVEVAPSGELVGTQTRLGNDGSTTLGTDVFTSTGSGTPSAIPLPSTVLGGGATYSYTNTTVSQPVYALTAGIGGIGAFANNANAIGTGGIIAGQIQRYAGDAYATQPSYNLGTDGFYYNPTAGTTTAIGLTGGVYSYTPSGKPSTFVAQGATVTGTAGSSAVGFNERFDSSGDNLGYDSWVYTPASGTVQIGLIGGAYTATATAGNSSGNPVGTYQESQTFRTDPQGQIAGKSYQPDSDGNLNSNVAWLYTPPSAGYSSAGTYTAGGFGSSPSGGTYTQLGLSTAASGSTLGYVTPSTGIGSITANTNLAFLNKQGHAAGTTNRYDSSGTYQGQAAWYYDGTQNYDISPAFLNPSDTIHAAVSGGTKASSNTVTAINNNGLVAGYATRIAGTTSASASLGQDAYVYDSNTKTEYFVDPTDESKGTGNYELSVVGVLGDDGVAVGYYNTYSGATSSTITGSTLFDWSESTGLQALATYPASASSSMQAYVDSFEIGSDGTIYGPNTYGSSATSIVAYTAVPEPSALGLLGVSAIGLLVRRRRAM